MLNLNKIFYGIGGAAQQLLGSTLGLVAPSIQSQTPVVAPGQSLGVTALVDGANIPVDAELGNLFTLTCASNAARIIDPPTNGEAGQEVAVRIRNTSGGALTNTTFAVAIRKAAPTLPANNFQREYRLRFDGTDWSLVLQSAADIPN